MGNQGLTARTHSVSWLPVKLQAGKSFGGFVKAVWHEVLSDDCIDLAAQMAFYFSLSLFPFLIVIAAFVGWLPPSTTLWHNLAQWMTDYLPLDARRMVFVTILSLTQSPTTFLSFGLIATIWTASSGWVSLMESLTVAYGFKDTRGFWRKRAIAVCATIVGAVFFPGGFFLMTIGHRLTSVLVHAEHFFVFSCPGKWGDGWRASYSWCSGSI